MEEIAERYVLLGLRLERHVEGFVDAYYGPIELKERVTAEDPADPRALEEEADSLSAAVANESMDEQRTRWLRAQLAGLSCVAARLAGNDIAWVDEVERCLGIRPALVDLAAIEEVHRRLDAVLPGKGTVRERYLAWEEESALDRDSLVPALERLKDMLRSRSRSLAPLPPEESVVYELVSGKPWLAYNWYRGAYRSTVEVNADLPISINVLADLVAHEAYPGHHTEHAAKESRLLRELDRLECAIVVVSAPESLISEGIAMNALEAALGEEPFGAIAEALAGLGVSFDVDAAQQIHEADRALFDVATNVAILIHEEGMTREEAGEYLREWGLLSDEKAERMIGFVSDPPWRAYTPAYTYGHRLCRAFMDRVPGGFARLLTEQLTTTDLFA